MLYKSAVYYSEHCHRQVKDCHELSLDCKMLST